MDADAHEADETPPPAPFYTLFPKLGWAWDDVAGELDPDLPGSRWTEPRLRIVA